RSLHALWPAAVPVVLRAPLPVARLAPSPARATQTATQAAIQAAIQGPPPACPPLSGVALRCASPSLMDGGSGGVKAQLSSPLVPRRRARAIPRRREGWRRANKQKGRRHTAPDPSRSGARPPPCARRGGLL